MHNPTTFPSLSLFTHFPFTFSFIFQQEGEATIEDIPLRRVARTQPQPETTRQGFFIKDEHSRNILGYSTSQF